MKFNKLKANDGEPIYVNPSFVRHLYFDKDKDRTCFTYSNGDKNSVPGDQTLDLLI